MKALGNVNERIASDARDWLILLNSGKVTAHDIANFRAWQGLSDEHARIFEQERKVWQDIGALTLHLEKKTPPPRVSRRMVLRTGMAFGAVAGGAVLLPSIVKRAKADYQTDYGEQRTITLPDETDVLLNTDTMIALDFGPDRRGVTLLQGEAFFRVRNGAEPFVVAAGSGFGRTAFGEFAMRYENDQVLVTAVTEIVTASNNLAATRVAPAHRIGWRDGQSHGAPVPVDVTTALAWRDGRIEFDNTAFSQAAMELGRYLPEAIILRGNANSVSTISGNFATRDAYDGLVALAHTQNLSIRRIPNIALIVS